LGLVLYSFFSGHFLPGIYSPAIIAINIGMNNHYHSQIDGIENEGNYTLNRIVEDTNQYGNNPARLSIIADRISENFTDIYWSSQQNEKYFCNYTTGNGNYEWVWCPPYNGFFGNNPHSYGYVSDKQGRVRTLLSNDLNYNPKWIAYQKTKACEAISIFFNETTNRSGFASRIVRSDSAGHTWNEVMVNGEWKYYDVQRYGQVKNTNESSFWFGNRSEFGYKSGFNHSKLTNKGVYVFDQQNYSHGEEITQYYKVRL
jgi:hypothetical protein